MSQDHLLSQLGPTRVPAHVIRLHGPWRYEPLARTECSQDGESTDVAGELPAAGTVNIPADWAATLGTDFRGRVLYKRRFGRPTNLDPSQRIDLVLDQVKGLASITLNGVLRGTMTSNAAWRIELTGLLLPRNELQVEVNLPRSGHDDAAGGIVGEVRLEFYEPSVDEPMNPNL